MINQNIEPAKNNNPTPHKIQEDRQLVEAGGGGRQVYDLKVQVV